MKRTTTEDAADHAAAAKRQRVTAETAAPVVVQHVTTRDVASGGDDDDDTGAVVFIGIKDAAAPTNTRSAAVGGEPNDKEEREKRDEREKREAKAASASVVAEEDEEDDEAAGAAAVAAAAQKDKDKGKGKGKGNDEKTITVKYDFAVDDFKCVICADLIQGQIFRCLGSVAHMMCETCCVRLLAGATGSSSSSAVAKCAVCRHPAPFVRDPTLERALATALVFTCPNTKLGCTYRSTDEHDPHECSDTLFKCPHCMAFVAMHGDFPAIAAHLLQTHATVKQYTTNIAVSAGPDSAQGFIVWYTTYYVSWVVVTGPIVHHYLAKSSTAGRLFVTRDYHTEAYAELTVDTRSIPTARPVLHATKPMKCVVTTLVPEYHVLPEDKISAMERVKSNNFDVLKG